MTYREPYGYWYPYPSGWAYSPAPGCAPGCRRTVYPLPGAALPGSDWIMPGDIAPGDSGVQLREQTLAAIEPVVQYGLREARSTSVPHAMREVAAITLLMGRGYDASTARRIVESWEIDERFPRVREG